MSYAQLADSVDRLNGTNQELVDVVLQGQDAIKVANYTALRAYKGRATTVQVTQYGIAGVFDLVAGDQNPFDDKAVYIAAKNGGRWKRRYTGLADVRWWGASPVNDDNYAALSDAIASGMPLLLDGHFRLKKRLLGTGSLLLVGMGRDKSSLTWPVDSVSIGFQQTPLSLTNQIRIQDFEMISAAKLNGEMWKSSWSGLTDYNTLHNFSYKFIADRVVIRCVDNGTFTKGVMLENLFGGVIEHCHVYGAFPTTFNHTENTYPTSHCFHIANDKSASNTVGIKFNNNHSYYGRYANRFDDVEGLEYNNNDIQASWDGLWIENTIRKVNQYRIRGGHIGVNNIQIKAINARCVKVDSVEVSWGGNRANGASITMIDIISVLDFAIAGTTTIRGNGATTTYGHNITGVRIDGTAADQSNNAVVDDVTFRGLTSGVVQGANCVRLTMGLGNTFEDVGTRYTTENPAGAVSTVFYGNGPHARPAGVGPMVVLTGDGGSALALNRNTSNGAVLTFHKNNAALSGSITIGDTSTAYNTSSDMSLKDDKGICSGQEAQDRIMDVAIRDFTWKSTGEADQGVFAQELHKVFPKAVAVGGWVNRETGEWVEEDHEDAVYFPWSVDYSKLIPALLASVQHLTRRVKELEEKDSTS